MESTDRSLQSMATQAGKTASSTGAQYGGQAQSLYGNLIPTLEREAAGGQGLTPTQKSQMLTAAEQGGGGAAGGDDAGRRPGAGVGAAGERVGAAGPRESPATPSEARAGSASGAGEGFADPARFPVFRAFSCEASIPVAPTI